MEFKMVSELVVVEGLNLNLGFDTSGSLGEAGIWDCLGVDCLGVGNWSWSSSQTTEDALLWIESSASLKSAYKSLPSGSEGKTSFEATLTRIFGIQRIPGNSPHSYGSKSVVLESECKFLVIDVLTHFAFLVIFKRPR